MDTTEPVKNNKLVQVKDKVYYMDGYLKKNLDYIQEKVLRNKDMMVMIIDGRPGTGKSTLGAQIAYYLSKGGFNNDFENFDVNQFNDCLSKMKYGDAVILDEAFDVLNKRKTLSSSNMLSLGNLQKMRAKCVFIIILLPSVYDLDRNLVLNLCDLFIHCYRKDFGKRGQFLVYNRHALKKLYLGCRQSFSYNPKIAPASFRGRFTKFFPIDEKIYEAKKLASIGTSEKNPEKERIHKYQKQRDALLQMMYEKGIPVPEFIEKTDMKKTAIYEAINHKKRIKTTDVVLAQNQLS